LEHNFNMWLSTEEWVVSLDTIIIIIIMQQWCCPLHHMQSHVKDTLYTMQIAASSL
jgi:hypothetical protein